MLRRSNDRKVAASVTPSGNVRIANAFGLPSGKSYSCPYATTVCEKVCYAGKIEKVRKSVMALLVSNFEQLQNATESEMTGLIREMVADFSAECERKNGQKAFRIHWDGDFFSAEYARAWATVIREFPDVQFWAYTRSFVYVPILTGIPNLALYLSVDRDNLEWAKTTRKENPGVMWAFLSQTFEDGKSQMLALGNKPGAACPELKGQIPLITPSGGACITCGLCVKGKSDIRFAIGKK